VRKGTLLFVTALLLLALLMTGCGVAQAEYDAVVAERDATKAQVASLEAQVTSLEADLNEAKANYEGLKSDVTSIWTALDKKLAAAGMIFSFWSDAGKADVGLMSASDYEKSVAVFIANFGGVLDNVGNPQVSKMWEDAVLAAGRDDTEEFGKQFAGVMDSLTELIEKDVAEINAKLR